MIKKTNENARNAGFLIQENGVSYEVYKPTPAMNVERNSALNAELKQDSKNSSGLSTYSTNKPYEN